jgi:glutamine synthetase
MDVTKLFGSNVFNDTVMKKRLPKDTYKALKHTIMSGEILAPEVAEVVANAMKDWAIEKGATHYTHWFQPLTGSTAEKHDSFISPNDKGGVVMEFSGKQLNQGEPDASSFPSGGLRATFEARGYTAWDCTSPAFIKEDATGNKVLYIPTAFCSYTGEALDKKTPLLRSMGAVSKQAIRLLRALGNATANRVTSTVGAEQEYFLVDKKYYLQRSDIMFAGRTLFGAPSPKGQELEDHYFGQIKDRIIDFMCDLDEELWKLGVTAKTRHNEVAPAQFELAPIFSTTNIAADHNQLVMETLQKVALRRDLVCLLHEKPYAGINGSGKHNNWSLSTDDGLNLLEPGKTPHDNAQFLAVVAAIIKAVDTHADMLRRTCASSGNDHRLGANEAPPAIISIFLGEELTTIMETIAKGGKAKSKAKAYIKIGVDSLPTLPKDNTDRNRTSPFAFTGNKFEFRMVGSSQSISGPNVVLNTIAAEVFDELATRLEKAKDVNREVEKYIVEVMRDHSRVIFNGNNYAEAWVTEAEKRGLPNIRSAVESLETMTAKKTVDIFTKYNVMSKREVLSRHDIYLEQYTKQINIEALTSINMIKTLFLPAGIRYATELAKSIKAVETAGGAATVQASILAKVSALLELIDKKMVILEKNLEKAHHTTGLVKHARAFRDLVVPAQKDVRADVDALEQVMPANLWPVPTYADLLFKL